MRNAREEGGWSSQHVTTAVCTCPRGGTVGTICLKVDSDWADTHSLNRQASNSVQQTNLPSRVQSRPDHPTHQRPTSWQKICHKTPSQQWWCGPTPHPCKLAHEVSTLRSIDLLFRCQRPPNGSVRRQGACGACAPCLLFGARARTTPSVVAPTQANSWAVSAHRTVTSTANCAPLEQRMSAGKDFDGPLVGCWHCYIHVMEFCVASDQRARVTTNAGQSSLWSDSPCAQPS